MMPCWCHSGVIDLTPYVDDLRHELAVAAEAGGEDARALAERLTAPLEAAARLVLLAALSAAADEITRDLAPGSVDVRLRGLEPDFVVTPPPADAGSEDVATSATGIGPPAPPLGDEGATSRINLRLPEPLKLRIEEAAAREGLSVNAWLVRTVAAALQPDDRGRGAGRRPSGERRYTGWVR
jgi:HicB family